MPKPIDNSGIYILEIELKQTLILKHKKFNETKLVSGFYYYVGSAQKNLLSRIKRHYKKDKKLHWHIDYLTSRREAEIKNAYIIKNLNKNYECKLTSELEKKFKLNFPIIGFGNSDCTRCKSHLLFSEKKIPQSQLLALYQSTVLFIPSSREIC